MAQENLSGRSVAGYRLIERVGEGGTAMVYRAEHADHRRCAVKILKPRLRTDENARKRFLRESDYGQRVQHPSVVQTYGYGEEDGLYYLALEWAEGEPLSDFLERTGRLSPKVVAHILTQLAGETTQKIKQATMVKVDTAKAKRRKDGKKHMFNNELIDKAVDAFDFDSLV